MENTSSAWVNMLMSWAPLIVLLGLWALFMRVMRKSGGLQTRYMERQLLFMDKQEQLLERIAVALERHSASR